MKKLESASLEDIGFIEKIKMQTFIPDDEYAKRGRKLYERICDSSPNWANAYISLGTYCRYLPGEINLPSVHILYLKTKKNGVKNVKRKI